MKILMVNKFLYPNGGSETYMLKLGSYLQELGHEVQYFGMQDERNVVGNQIEAYVPNIDFHQNTGNAIHKIGDALSTIYSKKACKEIGKVLQAFKPDIVHMNNINFQLTPAIIYEIRKAGVPIVQTVHDVQIACPCHRFYIEHSGEICEQCKNGQYWKCIKNKCLHGSRLKSFLAAVESYYYHFRNTYNMVDIYICPSKFIAEKIINAGVQKKRISVQYNFIDKIIIPNNNYEGKKYVIYFGRLSQEKGIETLIRVCKTLPKVNLVVAGSGPLVEMVRKAAGDNQNIEFVGFKTGDELKQLIYNASFSIYPSEWYENCPLSVIESQALGTPVIGSDLGGTKELIDNEKTGLIFEGTNETALKDAVERLWNQDSLVEEMSKNCLEINSNTIDIYADQLIKKYIKIQSEYKRG